MQLDNDDARLLHWIDRAFLNPKPKKIGVAVSGGGDSVALLHLCQRWAETSGIPVLAVTVDHGLREGSADEAEGVAKLCQEIGVAHDVLRWGNWDGHGNLQAAARAVRYRLIADWAKDNGVQGVVLGHTQDDNAENFVLRLARKSGIDGLSAMARQFERGELRWARPFSTVSRADLREYLRRHAVSWVEDPSNDNIEFERVRVRKALETFEELGVTSDALLQTGIAASQARDALDYYVRQEAERNVRAEAGDVVLADISHLPEDIQRRLWSKIVQWMGGLEYPPRASSIAHLRTGVSLEGKSTAGGCIAMKLDGSVRFQREANAVKMISCASDQVWDGRWRMNGPHTDGLEIRALGDGILECPDWREAGLPRASLLASPAVWSNETLIAAPIAGYCNGWTAKIVADFNSWLVTH